METVTNVPGVRSKIFFERCKRLVETNTHDLPSLVQLRAWRVSLKARLLDENTKQLDRWLEALQAAKADHLGEVS